MPRPATWPASGALVGRALEGAGRPDAHRRPDEQPDQVRPPTDRLTALSALSAQAR
ncbi:MAG TPA: hypothetical protein VGM75_19765 [Pseudonocardiaceae bacterium]